MPEARKVLETAIIYYHGCPVGTVAACDPEVEALNYDQCFVRDFVASALVFLMDGRSEIVRNFLVETLALQSREKQMNCFKPGQGLMPASFKVESNNGKQSLVGDFGDHAIARVAPVDSCLWWIILYQSAARRVRYSVRRFIVCRNLPL